MRRPLASLVVLVVLALAGIGVAEANGPAGVEYLSPLPSSTLVSAGTTIAIRQGEVMDRASISPTLFRVSGTSSGLHAGHALLADDERTVIFAPDRPFAPGETVSVAVNAGLRTSAGALLPGGLSFDFTISPRGAGAQAVASGLETLLNERPAQIESGRVKAAGTSMPHYVTAPGDLPNVTITVPPSGTGSGYLFLAPFSWNSPAQAARYLLIVDDSGELVYYQNKPTSLAFDFKKQPNGLLTYFDSNTASFPAMDSSYATVDNFAAGNGYQADVHDLQLLPGNGHALLLIYDPQPVDMSLIAPGGVPTATVIGLVVQELDTSKNVVFQWRSWDHFNITDTQVSLTTQTVDYVHGNAVERDSDGNLLISSRHLSEVTKIDRQTGAIIWRLGGKNNQFALTNNDPFSFQHDIRRLANGDITLFDDGNLRSPVPYSRAVEFALDESLKIATSVWQFRDSPDVVALAMGNAQRLPNGNTLIGWGLAVPTITEAKPDGTKAFELTLDAPMVSYRSFRFPWDGFPSGAPTLVLASQNPTQTLYCSWNGATHVAYYRIYGGKTPNTPTLLGTRARTGFEMSYDVTNVLNEMCYFRVMPVDNAGHTTTYSNLVFPLSSACSKQYLPIIPKNGT
jgi:hypothetical protein